MITTVLMSVFGVYALVLFLAGLLAPGARSRAWPGAAAAGSAVFAAQSDSFWTMVSLGLIALWFTVLALPLGDTSFRVRFGLLKVVSVFAFLTLWPTFDVASGGKFPCPRYIEERVEARLVAGLDLRGGLRLAYTVDVAEAVKDKRDGYYDDMRKELSKLYAGHSGDEAPSDQLLEKLKESVEISAPRSPSNLIRLKVKDSADPSKLDARFRDLWKVDLDLRQLGPREFEFSIRRSTESAIRERAVAQAKEIILRRVDALGLREAAVSTRDEDIIVEVPGENEAAFASIREIIGQTARLEFKLLDDDSNFFAELERTAAPDSLPEGLTFQRERVSAGVDSASGEPVERFPTFAFLPIRKGEKSQATLDRLKGWVGTLTLPEDREVGFGLERAPESENSTKEIETGFRTYLLKSRTELTGDLVREAVATPDNSGRSLGGWLVALTFTDQGGRIFERITGNNVKRRFAILLDGRVESSPVIQDRIPGGHATITMGSSDPEVQLRDSRKLELVLRSGALPAPITPSNEQLIGPSLGRDAIKLALQGAAGGALIVLLFMAAYYAIGGVIADIAVLLNLVLQLAILASFGASMTLPGIAGLALTIGMSVDANILINERIREELREGKSSRVAVELGYSKAFSAILDGQLTTLIAGLVLAQYGTGPIKGFAVTLIVGVLCSIYTGVFVSRVLFELYLKRLGNKKLSVG